MGGRSYLLATRMPMSRAGFEAWLNAPLPGLDVIENPAAMWTGDVYPDLPLGGDQPLAVLLVDRAGARFVDRYPVGALIERLRPVEAAFLAAGEAAGGEGDWNAEGLVDPLIRDGDGDG
ncbi:hypothetical protein ACFPIJ_29875 [Dactylosporangium cerinum]|uniref:Uncharacterized protein n=1 Tax=Dactylosporangium cerinum TaxID=1434730 RepID=A0ABV9W3T7_9ACTN